MENNQYSVESIRNFQGKYPKQLYILFFTEMWERFTFYGMRALLILFMTKQLFYADGTANLKYGAYNAFVYAMGIFGGMFADKFLGSRRSILYGGVMMAIGSFTLVLPYESTFYLGLGIIIVGNGFFKPNISTMVGQLYHDNDPRRDAGFSLFYSGINFGAFFGGLICGWVGETYSWHLGFGLAGLFMIFGLAVFMIWQKQLGPIGLPPEPEKLKQKYMLGLTTEQFIYAASILMIPLFMFLLMEHSIVDYIMIPLFPIAIFVIVMLGRQESKEGFRKLMAALILIVFSSLFWAFYEQGGGSMNLYADRNVDMTLSETKTGITLTAPVNSGENMLSLSGTSGLEKGDMLRVRSGNDMETKLLVDSMGEGNTVYLAEKVKGTWPAGSSISEVSGLSAAAVNNAINPLYIIIFSPIIGLFWIFLSKKNKEPNSAVKFSIGLLLLGFGFYIFAWSAGTADVEGRVSLWAFCLAYFVITMGELCLSPIGLSMVTKLSPAKIVGLMMGMWFLASAFGQYLAGWIGSQMAVPSEGADGRAFTSAQSLGIYSGAFEQIALVAVIFGILLLLLSPMLKKFMGGIK